MDNVIQHIKIEDIVPSNQNYNIIDIKILEDLAISIKNNGIKEPLRLKRIDNKYKIISGNKRYRAAILAGLSELPAIIENYDNIYINKIDTNYSNSINNNSDIINLSELNKEYERDDFKMNNEFMNNVNNMPMPEQPVGPQNAAPTFGGRFFPSLEDEPTNMNFNTAIEPNQGVIQDVQPTNNLIDLTDMSNNVSNQSVVEPIMSTPQIDPTSTATMMPQPEINNGAIPQNNGNVIDIASLTQNNSMVSPIQETPATINMDNNFQEVVNDFQPKPTPEMNFSQAEPTIEPMMGISPLEFNQSQVIPEQSMENVEPVLNPMEQVVSPMPSVDQMINMTPDVGPTMMNQPVEQVMPNIVSENINIPSIDPMNQPINPMPTFDMSMVQNVQAPIVQEPVMMEQPQQPIMNEVPEPIVMEQPMVQEPIVSQEMVNQMPQKDILPVINTLKAVGVNLENFGYTIRITDEDLPTSYKITIEIDK